MRMSVSPSIKPEQNLYLLSSEKNIDEMTNPISEAYIFIRAFGSGNYDKLKYEEIVMIKSSGNYSTIFTSKGKSYFTSKTLKCWCSMLECDRSFIRCHASYLINKNSIVSIDKTHQKIKLEHNLTASVSRRSWNPILSNLYQNSNIKRGNILCF